MLVAVQQPTRLWWVLGGQRSCNRNHRDHHNDHDHNNHHNYNHHDHNDYYNRQGSAAKNYTVVYLDFAFQDCVTGSVVQIVVCAGIASLAQLTP